MDILSIVLGGFIGFISATGKDILVEKNKAQIKIKELKRQKLEEAFLIADVIFKESIKPLIAKGSLSDGSKLGMIIRFYFPNLQSDYDTFYNDIMRITLKTISIEEVKLTQAEIIECGQAYEKFLACIVKESEKYL